MKKVTYLAVFEPGEDGYSVYFPDLPGCVSYGETFAAAREAAADALGLCLYGMEQDGETIPPPSERPVIDPETAAGYLISPVTVFPAMVRNELDNRRVKTNVMAERGGGTASRELLPHSGKRVDGLPRHSPPRME